MLSFKPKTNKAIEYSYKQNMTLDQKHMSIIEEIKARESQLPLLKKKLSIVKNKLSNLNKDKTNIELYNSLNKEYSELKKEINNISKQRKKYYLDNSHYIFKYFEDKKNINIKNNEPENNSIDAINVFFNIKKDNACVNNTNSNSNTNTYTKNDDYIYEYMKNMDDSYFDLEKYAHPEQKCITCLKGEMIHVACDGVVVCNNCGIQHLFITDTEKPSYKEPPKEVCFYAYKRINHFREILNQFQAKESTFIPPEILDKIKFQIKKERLSLNELSYTKTKEILKILGLNKFYEHIAYIKDKLGIKPPIMSPKLEDMLCTLFTEIQSSYSKYCPDDRTNFLNYYYTLFKLCELLDQHEYLPLLKEAMLGDRTKRVEQDDVWKKICNDMDWEFIPTE